MAKRHRIRELEKQHGDLHKVIPPLVNELGQGETARKLSISQATISNWLKQNRYVKVVYYRKQENRGVG